MNDLKELTAQVVAAYVSHNPIASAALPFLLADVYDALSAIGTTAQEPKKEPLTPAVSIKKSITPDFLICLDDGQKCKTLKRHLAALGMTPAEYRAKWGLPRDYPMTAPNYSARRTELARAARLGHVQLKEAA